MILDAAPVGAPWYQLALAVLNVVQTIALAYLAASQQRRRRNGGQS